MIASAVLGDVFIPHVDQGRAYIRYVCKKLLEHPTFNSDSVVGLACFDYSVLFTLPRSQAAECCYRLFQSFCVRWWLSKELRIFHVDGYMEIVGDLRFVYLDDLHFGPIIGDMVTFLIYLASPDLSKWDTFLMYFNCFLCLGHFLPTLPAVF